MGHWEALQRRRDTAGSNNGPKIGFQRCHSPGLDPILQCRPSLNIASFLFSLFSSSFSSRCHRRSAFCIAIANMSYSLLFALVLGSAQALQVSSGSSCADVCEGPTNTFPTDLSCVDDDYTSTDRGSLMKACIECESQSTYVDTSKDAPQDNDQYWMLFNMKYSLQYCLTQTTDGTPNFSECNSSCEGLYPSLSPSWFATPRPPTYDYCTIKDDAFTSHVDTCASCLLSRSGSVVLGNFLIQMKSGCDTQASAHDGATVPIQRQLFDTSTVASASSSVSSSPSSSTTSAASSAIATGGSSTTASPTESSSQPTSSSESAGAPVTASNSSSGLSSGAAAGIGVGCGLGALALGIAAFWYYRRRRNTVRVPRSTLEQPPHYDNQPPSNQTYNQINDNKPLSTPSRAESYGHERYEMGGHEQRSEMDTTSPMKSEGTYASELDSRSVPR